MSLIGRIAIIILAFLIASIACGITIAFALLGPDWPALSGTVGERTGFWILVFFASSFSGAVAILPLFVVVVAAEAFRLRSLLLYMAAGAVVLPFGYLASGFADNLGPGTAHLPISHELAIAVAGGVVFGFVYWLLAGRKAGLWHQRV